MKKRRFQSGGLTQADIDAGLTQADIDAGLRAGRNERISDEDRMRARINAEKYASPSIVDQYRDYSKNPAAEAMPVDLSERTSTRATTRPAPRSTPRPAPRVETAPLAREPMPNEIPSVPEPAEPRRAPPSRGSYDRPGPIGDLINIIRNSARRGRGNPNPSIYRGEPEYVPGAKRGGSVNKLAKKKSSVSSASKRGDGIATKGKTKGRMI